MLRRARQFVSPLADTHRRSPDFPAGETVVQWWPLRQFYAVDGPGFGRPGRLILTDNYVLHAGVDSDAWWPRADVRGFSEDTWTTMAKFGDTLVLLQPSPPTSDNVERFRQAMRAATG